MTLEQKLQTPEAQAAQVVIAKIIDLVPNAENKIILAEADVMALQNYLNGAIALDPTNEEALAASVLLVNTAAEGTKNEKFKAFASKVTQAWEVISDEALSTIQKITQTIGIIFQRRSKAIEKL